MIFVPVAVIAAGLGEALLARENRGRHLARTLLILAGSVLVVAPYLVYNRMSFGNMMPINGILKSSFPHASPSGYALRALGRKGWVCLCICTGYLAWFAIRSLTAGRRGEASSNTEARRYFRAALAVMACAVLMHFVHTVLFMKWAVFSWHYIPYVLSGAVMVCEPGEPAEVGGGWKAPSYSLLGSRCGDQRDGRHRRGSQFQPEARPELAAGRV